MSTHAAITDMELLRVYARERSPDAFAELVRRYAGLVYNVGLRITRSREDAQDVAQECFLQLAGQAAKVVQPLPAWLHTLARSRAIDLIRRRGTRQRHEQQAMRREDSALSLEEWETLSRQVDEAIERLPEELRHCLIGIYLQGRAQQELAEDLGVAQGTISRRVERAIEQLRDRLRQSGVEMPAASLVAALSELAPPPPNELPAALTKIGLSGVGTGTATAGKLPLVAASLAIIAAAAGIVYWATHASGPARSGQPTGAPNMTTTQPAAQNALVRRENNLVWIEGISAGQRGTNPYSQGFSILLQQLGHRDAAYERVMGYSGVAFALQMDLSGPIRDGKYDVAWWPNDLYAFGLRAEFVGRAFGRELRWMHCDQDAYRANSRAEYQKALEPAIVEAINQGLPVLGQQDSAVLVTGYDLRNHTPIVVWPSPGQPAFGPPRDPSPWGIFVPGKAIDALPQDQAELESLRWAISLWDETAAATAKGWDASKILTGSKAFATWLELLQQQKDGVGLGRDSWDNNLMIHLRYNQTAAVAYLRDVATRHPAAETDLDAAADLYEAALGDCNQAPFWGRTPPDKRDQGLRDYTDTVRRTMQRHGQAIDHLRRVVTAWPVGR